MGIDMAAFAELSAEEAVSINEHLNRQGFVVPDTSYEDDPLGFLLDVAGFYEKVRAFIVDHCLLQ